LDAARFITGPCSELDSRSLVYLDPPYFQKGQQLYRNFYTPEDHVEIAEAVKHLRTPWLVTYDNAPEVTALYTDFPSCKFGLRYSSTLSRDIATEQMIWSGLKLPMRPTLSRTPGPYAREWERMSISSWTQPATA
jgi:DNA adenine methylase